MLPIFVYAQIRKDILYAFINGEFTTKQLKKSLKAARIEIEKDYGKDINIFKD